MLSTPTPYRTITAPGHGRHHPLGHRGEVVQHDICALHGIPRFIFSAALIGGEIGTNRVGRCLFINGIAESLIGDDQSHFDSLTAPPLSKVTHQRTGSVGPGNGLVGVDYRIV